MAYLLDANVFIAANNLHYDLDFCSATSPQRVFSVDKVGDAVQAVGNELSERAAARGKGFLLLAVMT